MPTGFEKEKSGERWAAKLIKESEDKEGGRSRVARLLRGYGQGENEVG